MPLTGLVSKIKVREGFDPKFASAQLDMLRAYMKENGADKFYRAFLVILRKKEVAAGPEKPGQWNTRLVPYTMNRMQADMRNTFGPTDKFLVSGGIDTLRNITLKWRQGGSTTHHIIDRLYVPTILNPGTNSLLISQTRQYALDHFAILRRAHKYFGRANPFLWTDEGPIAEFHKHLLHTQYSARHELVFDFLDSRVAVDTSENEEVGQGATLHHVVCCLGPDTLIPTADNRLVKISSLKHGDKVLGSTGRAVTVLWSGYINAKSHPYLGRAYRIEVRGNAGMPLLCSPNHEFMTQRGTVRAEELKTDDFFAYPKRSFSGSLLCLPVVQHKAPRAHGGGKQPLSTPAAINLDRELGFACGLYLAEGCINPKNPNRFSYHLSGDSETHLFERAYARVASFISSTNCSKRGRDYMLYGRNLACWILEHFGSSSQKRVPIWIWEAPREFALGLLEGWLAGDGSVAKGGGRQIRGVSKLAAIAYPMRDICFALGLGGVSLRRTPPMPRKRQWSNGYTAVDGRGRYDLGIDGISYDRLAGLLCSFWGHAHVPYKSKKKQPLPKFWRETDTHILFRIKTITKTKCRTFFDIQVDAEDHLYCLPSTVTHNTEVSRWAHKPEETLANLKEAIVLGGTLDIECTPNGMGGYFFEEWQRAKQWPNSEFRPHFYPWWWAEDCAEDTKLTEEELNEQERKMVEELHIGLREIQFRRNKMVALRHNFPEKYPENDVDCFLTSGRMYFDSQILRNIQAARQIEKPLEVHGNGDYIVYKKRIPGRRYLLGIDAAEGKLVSTTDPDFNSLVVIDLDTAEEVAAYRNRIPPEYLAHEAADIAAAYNGAVIAVERNGPGASVILTLEREILYPNIFYYPDRAWLKEKQVFGTVMTAGFPTNVKTRQYACSLLRRIVEEAPEMWHDLQFISEAFTFTYDKNGKPCAQESCHDDTVSARWVAAAARAVLLGFWDPSSTTGPTSYEGDTPDA